MTVEVGVGQHAMKAYPHPQEDDAHSIEHQREIDKVTLIRRTAVHEKQRDTVDHDHQSDHLHQFGLVIHSIATNDYSAVLILAVQQTHLFEQRNQRQRLHWCLLGQTVGVLSSGESYNEQTVLGVLLSHLKTEGHATRCEGQSFRNRPKVRQWAGALFWLQTFIVQKRQGCK